MEEIIGVIVMTILTIICVCGLYRGQTHSERGKKWEKWDRGEKVEWNNMILHKDGWPIFQEPLYYSRYDNKIIGSVHLTFTGNLVKIKITDKNYWHYEEFDVHREQCWFQDKYYINEF